MSEKITITRALRDLKLLDKKIKRKISNMDPVNHTIGDYPVSGYNDTSEFIKKAKSDYQSVCDLISLRSKIKSGVVKHNAFCEISIDSTKMTVAEAIERKRYIEEEKQLLSKMKYDYTNTTNKIENHNKSLEDVVNQISNALVGRSAKLKDAGIETIKSIANDSKLAKIVDPLNISKLIDELEEKIDNFIAEVDISLVESNSKNTIEI